MFLVVKNGLVYAPEPAGTPALLIAADRIVHIGAPDPSAIERMGLPLEVIDASDCIVVPGLIDVHEHLLGGSGEQGWPSQTPEISLHEIVKAGITTVVGCLGTDTITKTMEGLLGKARALSGEGLTAFIWSGGYEIPPRTLTGSIKRDMLLINEVIGAGEIAIADRRSSAPQLPELARLVKDTYVGGTLTGKAGVTHFHVGEEPRMPADVRELLDNFDIEPGWVYPTHVERSDALMLEAVALSNRGVTVDVDTVDHDLGKWLPFFLENGGAPDRITVSSDAAINSPGTLIEQVRCCVLEKRVPLETVLPCVTATPASVLKLTQKGRIAVGFDADLLILRRDSLEIVEVIARGRRLLKEGRLAVREAFLEKSNRKVELHGAAI